MKVTFRVQRCIAAAISGLQTYTHMSLISLPFVFLLFKVVEKFLSKELSCVVTDQPIASVRSTSQRKETTGLTLSGLRGVSIYISYCSI